MVILYCLELWFSLMALHLVFPPFNFQVYSKCLPWSREVLYLAFGWIVALYTALNSSALFYLRNWCSYLTQTAWLAKNMLECSFQFSDFLNLYSSSLVKSSILPPHKWGTFYLSFVREKITKWPHLSVWKFQQCSFYWLNHVWTLIPLRWAMIWYKRSKSRPLILYR